ncbi:four helix bundle protein [uncultured Nonlabens sp.]|uniref:four helix bundle protein n=1 Tax=uncultured Nonlabens sp. TaxID=859306 RepID=UPI0026305598|nr:four helix bundle protein [uncultured Nonlabens sp.]
MSNGLKLRSKKFTHRYVKLALLLPNHTLGNHVKGQLIRCFTSTAVNYRAACVAISTKSFVAKLSISIEEVDECDFRIQFAVDEKLFSFEKSVSLIKEFKELTAIFIASRKTAQKKYVNALIINH